MSWSNEITFKFIDLYQSEPTIWNPKNQFHKDKTKVNDAWDRISEEMDYPVPELKKKKETLMAAFRLNHKKKLASLKTSTCEDDVFKPIWIFYEPLASFMSDIYDCRSNNSISDTDGASSSISTFQEKWNPVIDIGVEELSNGENSQNQPHSSMPGRKRRRSETSRGSPSRNTETETSPHVCDKVFTNALTSLTKIISKTHNNESDEDECDIYGKLIAKKLRRYSYLERLELMYEIDSLVIQKRMKLEPRGSSPDYNSLDYSISN